MSKLPLPFLIAVPYALIYLILYLILNPVPRGMYCPRCESRAVINRWQPGPLILLALGFPFTLFLLVYERFACTGCGHVFRGLVTEYMRQGPYRYCPGCNKEFETGESECPGCSLPLEDTMYCPRCKSEFQLKGGKCPECGINLEE